MPVHPMLISSCFYEQRWSSALLLASEFLHEQVFSGAEAGQTEKELLMRSKSEAGEGERFL